MPELVQASIHLPPHLLNPPHLIVPNLSLPLPHVCVCVYVPGQHPAQHDPVSLENFPSERPHDVHDGDGRVAGGELGVEFFVDSREDGEGPEEVLF